MLRARTATRFVFILKTKAAKTVSDTSVKGTNNPRCNADKTYGPFVITAND